LTARRVAIVGGGASGTLLAVQLLAQARQPLEVTLIEPDRVGRGVAYGTPHAEHLLNVPAGNMSALADDPGHFVRWLERAGEPAGPGRFAPRRTYGTYLQATLAAAVANAHRGVLFHRLTDEAVALVPRPDEVSILLRSGRNVTADRAALATGHRPGRGPRPELAGHPRFVADPWALGALDGIAPAEAVLIVGTGLTMVDVAVVLGGRGHRGRILAVSRHGLLPTAHGAPVQPVRTTPRGTPTLRGWLRWAHAKRPAGAAPGDWRAVVDALRPLTPLVWQRLDEPDRRRFLRHLRAFWDVQRHRMPPAVAAQIADLRARGVLEIQAARVHEAVPRGDGFDVRLEPRRAPGSLQLHVAWIVNATGPEPDPGRADSPLLRQLLADGLVRADPLRLGLDATPAGALRDAAGAPSRLVHALGPLLRGVLWETIAVPEIRTQARALAQRWCGA
jgi:uncharacterized NAD(P)/FAD-binding protein YdhS